METVITFAAFVKGYERTSDGVDLEGITSHPTGFTFELADDEAQLGDFERDLVINILADVGHHRIIVKHADLDWEHRGSFTIDEDEGESSFYVVPRPIRVVARPKKTLNRFLISVDEEQVGTAYLYFLPVRF